MSQSDNAVQKQQVLMKCLKFSIDFDFELYGLFSFTIFPFVVLFFL